MSQFPEQFGQSSLEVPRKRSGFAIGSLVCSLIGLVPCVGLLMAPIGIILGLVGIAKTGSDSGRSGRGMALAGILIGVIALAENVYLVSKGVELIKGYAEYVESAPEEALQLAFAGDIAGFKQSFQGAGAAAPDAEAQAFIDELRSRYGEIVVVSIDEQELEKQSPAFGQPKIVMPYQVQFQNATLDARVEFTFYDEQAGEMWLKKIGYIEIIDPQLGNLMYPAPPGAANTRDGASSDGTDGEDGADDVADDDESVMEDPDS